MSLKRAVAAVLCVLSAPAVFGGVRYHFDFASVGQNHYSGTVAIDGTRERIDFAMVGREPRYCVVARDGGKHFRSYTESEYGKTYYEATPDDVWEGPVPLIPWPSARHVSNAHVTIRALNDHRTIAGYATRHVIADVSYDVVLQNGGGSLTLPMKTTWDAWLTDQLPASSHVPDFRLMLKNGAVEVDRLVDAHPELGGFVISAEGSLLGGVAKNPTKLTYTVNDVDPHASFPAGFFDGPSGFHKVMSPHERAEAINAHAREIAKGH